MNVNLDINKIKHEKEFNSFCKKVRINNRIWFDALSKNQQYDLFYEWKREKYNSPDKKKTIRNKYLRINTVIYPAKIKHFIREKMKEFRYTPKKKNLRDSKLDFILEKK